MWSKYRVQKKQIYQNGGWVDTDPLQTRTGEKIGEYDSFSGCSGIPPIFMKKLTANYSDSSTYTIDCNGSSVLTSGETNSYSTPVYMMTSATIGYCVTEIGELAFRKYNSQGIQNLSSVTLSDSVTTIDDMAFMGCSNLTTINLDNVTSIGLAAFRECGNLVLNDLPSGLTSISNEAFVWVRLQNCTIPSGVTTIGLGAFAGCDEMSTLTIPSGVTSIGEYAFQGCSGLTSITVEAITPPTLGYNVFINSGSCPIYVPCSSVATYKASSGWSEYASRIHGIPPCSEPVPPTPSNYKWLAAYSDSHTESAECDASSAITSGEVTKEGLQSFGIGNCVTSIDSSAFYHCSGLTSITIPNSVTTIGSNAFMGCSGLTSVTIPDSVTSIGNQAFYYCSGLTNVKISDNVTIIDNGTFCGCSGLTSVTIPSGVTSIGRSAFYDCRSLTSVTIPSGVTSIGHQAFAFCESFNNVTCLATTPPTLIADSFGQYINFYYTNNCPIYVPAASVNAYKSATGWSEYASRIQAIT